MVPKSLPLLELTGVSAEFWRCSMKLSFVSSSGFVLDKILLRLLGVGVGVGRAAAAVTTVAVGENKNMLASSDGIDVARPVHKATDSSSLRILE